MKLYLTRHGETEANISDIGQGQVDGRLTSRGERQAEQLARRLATESFDILYTSDLGRAMRTADAIAKFHPAVPRVETVDLREAHLGDHEGLPVQDFLRIREGAGEAEHEYQPPGGESIRAVERRTVAWLNHIRELHADQSVLVVSHTLVLCCLLAHLEGRDAADFRQYFGPNTALSIIEVPRVGPARIILRNDNSHLDPQDQSNQRFTIEPDDRGQTSR